MSRVYRTDISVLRPVERRANGTIVVDAFLSKCGVFQYMQPDGSIRRELRLPEDVHDAESLASFEGVPVTNNHPPGMIDAKNARQYSVGAVIGTPVPDADHIRGRLAVHDGDAVSDMEGGKVQVSNGYSCDCIEQPGVHPLYGPYDAIQKNIRGNHVAIVDRARAGVTAAARMDADRINGMMVLEPGAVAVLQPGMQIAVDSVSGSCKARAMSLPQTARIEVVVKNDSGEPSATAKVDPEDLASRNARGETSAKPHAKEQPGESYEDDGNDKGKPRKGKPFPPDDDEDEDDREDAGASDDDDDGDGDDSDESEDAMYDDAGKLTKAGKAKIAAHTYAVPGKEQLPMHSPEAVKDSMKKFPKHPFDDADQKHGAFNRLKGKALAFGMKDDAARFETKHGGKLDRADGANKDDMSTTDMQALQEKADKRKAKLVAAKARIDSLETELAQRDAQIQNLTKELETAKAAPRADAASADEATITARVELLEQARATGAKVDAKMSPRAIKVATIKHVDGDDVADAKPDAYVDGVYEGALKRAKKDAADGERGNAALVAARVAVETARTNTHLDGTTDEEEAKAALRAANRQMINQPGKHRVAGR